MPPKRKTKKHQAGLAVAGFTATRTRLRSEGDGALSPGLAMPLPKSDASAAARKKRKAEQPCTDEEWERRVRRKSDEGRVKTEPPQHQQQPVGGGKEEKKQQQSPAAQDTYGVIEKLHDAGERKSPLVDAVRQIGKELSQRAGAGAGSGAGSGSGSRDEPLIRSTDPTQNDAAQLELDALLPLVFELGQSAPKTAKVTQLRTEIKAQWERVNKRLFNLRREMLIWRQIAQATCKPSPRELFAEEKGRTASSLVPPRQPGDVVFIHGDENTLLIGDEATAHVAPTLFGFFLGTTKGCFECVTGAHSGDWGPEGWARRHKAPGKLVDITFLWSFDGKLTVVTGSRVRHVGLIEYGYSTDPEPETKDDSVYDAFGQLPKAAGSPRLPEVRVMKNPALGLLLANTSFRDNVLCFNLASAAFLDKEADAERKEIAARAMKESHLDKFIDEDGLLDDMVLTYHEYKQLKWPCASPGLTPSFGLPIQRTYDGVCFRNLSEETMTEEWVATPVTATGACDTLCAIDQVEVFEEVVLSKD